MARLGAVTVYLHPICSLFGRNTSSPSFSWSSQQNTVRIREVGRRSQEYNSGKQHWPNTYEASIQSPALQNNNNKGKQKTGANLKDIHLFLSFLFLVSIQSVFVCMCTVMYRPEAAVGCLSILFSIFFETGSLPGPGAH